MRFLWASVLGALLTDSAAAAAMAEPSVIAAPPPEIDASSVTLFPDQGRLELKGLHLRGLRISWKHDARSGDDVCLDPKVNTAEKDEHCAFALPRDLPADIVLMWSPGAAAETGVKGTPSAAQALRPARVVVDRLLSVATAVDLTSGMGRIPLLHPEAVASVDPKGQPPLGATSKR